MVKHTQTIRRLERKRGHSVYHGSEELSFLAPELWDILSNSIKIRHL